MLRRRKTKAQSTAEYAILLSLVVAAALGMQHEVRRAIQGKMNDANIALLNVTGDLGGVSLGNNGPFEAQAGSKWRNQVANENRSEDPERTSYDFWQRQSTANIDFNANISQ